MTMLMPGRNALRRTLLLRRRAASVEQGSGWETGETSCRENTRNAFFFAMPLVEIVGKDFRTSGVRVMAWSGLTHSLPTTRWLTRDSKHRGCQSSGLAAFSEFLGAGFGSTSSGDKGGHRLVFADAPLFWLSASQVRCGRSRARAQSNHFVLTAVLLCNYRKPWVAGEKVIRQRAPRLFESPL